MGEIEMDTKEIGRILGEMDNRYKWEGKIST